VWRIREGISEALSKAGAVYKYDISLPLPQLYDLVEDTRARLKDEDGARAPRGPRAALAVSAPALARRLHPTAAGYPPLLAHLVHALRLPSTWPLRASPRPFPLPRSAATVVAFGHIGDGNLHLNISTPKKSQAVFDKIEPWVFEWAREKRGSISAEHGVGVMKHQYLHMSKSAETIALMQTLKRVMDPNGILNPYKVLPQGQAAA
jgi:FAD/FMN-containing dehydrogenase